MIKTAFLLSVGLVLVAGTLAPAAEFSGVNVFIPVVGRLPGAQGSIWRTDLIVSNPSRRFVTTAAIRFYPDTGTEAVHLVELQPRETRRFTDVVLSVFNLPESSGSIQVGTIDGRLVAARAYIYNLGAECGEFGQMVPGLPSQLLSQNTSLSDLPTPPDSRTNIGISNPNDSDAPVFINFFSLPGEFFGGFSIVVPARSVRRFDDVYPLFDFPPTERMTIEVRGALFLYVWASSVRNDTGDAAFIVGHNVD